MYTTMAILLGVMLDFLFGDPHSRWHPVVWIGKLITASERFFRALFPETPKGKRMAGVCMWLTVASVSAAVPAVCLAFAWRAHPYVYLALAAFMCYQIMAAKSLKDESDKVYAVLRAGSLQLAREAASMIVGRDTDGLDEAGVTRAAVETVAENTSDGCIAPLFFLALGGPVGGFFYKAVNTMDSMVGYKNETYIDFGRFAARMDDVCNFIPARIAAVLMTAAAFLCAGPRRETRMRAGSDVPPPVCGMDGKRAWRVFLRDRKKSSSPNAAQTEAVCAGALGVSLLGDASYFGELYHKETVGDPLREIEAEDIRRSHKLLYVTVMLGTLAAVGIRLAVGGILGWQMQL